jgi:tetratricopeptide (TPR) repeat protein
MDRCGFVSALLLFAACASGPQAPPSARELGRVHFPITAKTAAVQDLFDQGLGWCYGFHHDEALRCFRAAAAAEPQCAMAFWGLAYAAGPHINNMSMTPEVAEKANADAKQAQALAANATPLERALIGAVAARYTWPAPDDRKQLDRAYADAMRGVYSRHGTSPDVAALFAESLMDLRPWDLWQADGAPQPETPEILTVLETLLQAHPEHPQANHLYIHAVEASPRPERAVVCGERLRSLAPAAGHLVHMPAHVFMRVGRYEDAAECNRRGIAADLAIVARTGRNGFYEIYRAHNFHFLAFAATFEGRAEEAIESSRRLLRELPIAVVQELAPFLEGFMGIPYEVLLRFGRWQEMLAEPEPPAWQKSARALWHCGRGVAFAATGRIAEAKQERERYRAAVLEVPADWTFGNNPTRTVLAVGDAFLDGEVEYRAGNAEAAFAALRTAVERNDALHYDEPWGWMMPPRHALGALLLEAGRVGDAELVYREDLRRHPDNGWALQGLGECLRWQGRTAEATAVDGRFAKAWEHATVRISASCYCRKTEASPKAAPAPAGAPR